MKTLYDRFWAKVNKKSEEECWHWQGAKHERGYGYIYPGAELPSTRKMVYAHRVSLYFVDGIWDTDLSVMHKCDNTSCVNPSHLVRVPHKINMQDMGAKKRNFPRTQKLTALQREAIIKADKSVTTRELASLFSISESNCSRVRRGLTWSYQ